MTQGNLVNRSSVTNERREESSSHVTDVHFDRLDTLLNSAMEEVDSGSLEAGMRSIRLEAFLNGTVKELGVLKKVVRQLR